ncbi:MAG: radical SAM protein [Verrucomicrobia bacterium]|nr:radical SAM protein [Verrucomicrobiota bacterium]
MSDTIQPGSKQWDDWIRRSRSDLDESRRQLPVNQARWIPEVEPDEAGIVRPGLTLFLTNRECPWRCLMCDLWRETTLKPVPQGAIPQQIRGVLREAPVAEWIKLYNAGSFFDAGAIPSADHQEIAGLVKVFPRVTVECHPTLIGPRVLEFRDRLGGATLEVAMGLESAHPDVLSRLNKRMKVADFRRATGFLREAGVAVRTFLLLPPPFLPQPESLEWVLRSVRTAFEAGASVVSLVPTRAQDGVLEQLRREGQFREPTLEQIELTFEQSLALGLGRVFVDLWDLERFHPGPDLPERRERLHRMNLSQRWEPRAA